MRNYIKRPGSAPVLVRLLGALAVTGILGVMVFRILRATQPATDITFNFYKGVFVFLLIWFLIYWGIGRLVRKLNLTGLSMSMLLSIRVLIATWFTIAALTVASITQSLLQAVVFYLVGLFLISRA